MEGAGHEMNFAKLSQNEKLGVYGAVAVVVGGLVGYSYGLTVLAVLAAVALLIVLFLPQMSPNTSLPGSRGSLMVLLGGIAGAVMVLAVLLYIGTIFTAFNVRDLFFLIAVAGAVVMAWAGWQELQAEGGKFQLGAASSSSAAAAPPAASAPPAPSAPSAEEAPPAEPAAAPPPPAPSYTPPPAEPMGGRDDDMDREERQNP
jgi:hypothetical protein